MRLWPLIDGESVRNTPCWIFDLDNRRRRKVDHLRRRKRFDEKLGGGEHAVTWQLLHQHQLRNDVVVHEVNEDLPWIRGWRRAGLTKPERDQRVCVDSGQRDLHREALRVSFASCDRQRWRITRVVRIGIEQ